MPDSYTVQSNESLWSIAKKNHVSFAALRRANPQLASRQPPYGVSRGDVIQLPERPANGAVRSTCEGCNDCVTYNLRRPFLIAKAKDGGITRQTSMAINDDVLHGATLDLGGDAFHGTGATLPAGCSSASDDEATLKQNMLALLDVFAAEDNDGKARRLFNLFLRKNSMTEIFTDASLDRAVANNPHFRSFSDLVLNAPGATETSGNTRIHQHLQQAGWDINKVRLIDGLGVPAFNTGTKGTGRAINSGDWANGLAVMINGVQYAFIYVESYHYNSCEKQYTITLKYVLYDVFGLDDIDVDRYGIHSSYFGIDSIFIARLGITSWWQLQHQFDYVPVITKMVVTRSFIVHTP
jgi:LysM repeat protein